MHTSLPTDPVSTHILERLTALHTEHGTLKLADRPGTARILGGKAARPHHLALALDRLKQRGYAVLRDVSTYRQNSPGTHRWEPDTLYLVRRADLTRLQAEVGRTHLNRAPDATDLTSLTGPDPTPRVRTDIPWLIWSERHDRARAARTLREGYPDSPAPGDEVWRRATHRETLTLGRPDDWNPDAWAALPRAVTVTLRYCSTGTDPVTGKHNVPVYSDPFTVTCRRTTRPGFLRLGRGTPEHQTLNRLWWRMDLNFSSNPITLQFTLPGAST